MDSGLEYNRQSTISEAEAEASVCSVTVLGLARVLGSFTLPLSKSQVLSAPEAEVDFDQTSIDSYT